MGRDRWPKPKTYSRFAIDFHSRDAAEKGAKTAQRASYRPVHRYVLKDGTQRYVAFSLDDLIQAESDCNQSRPGHVA
jgi:hypothetical protein